MNKLILNLDENHITDHILSHVAEVIEDTNFVEGEQLKEELTGAVSDLCSDPDKVEIVLADVLFRNSVESLRVLNLFMKEMDKHD